MKDKIPALETLEIPPQSGPAQFTVIWLHGLGADGHNFAPVAPQLTQLQRTAAVRFIFPHAPLLPITLNGGMIMPAWFDLVSLEWESRWDEAGIVQACRAVQALITKEKQRGIPSSHIFLAGFSQGGAVALLAGLTYSEPLAGIMGLSTFLPVSKPLQQQFTTANQHTPILLAHGDNDAVIHFAMGKQTYQLLKQHNDHIEWQGYPGLAHSVSQQEIQDIDAWLTDKMKKSLYTQTI